MSRPAMTIALARAVAWDAGNRSMRKAGRRAWNENDWNTACETAAALQPLINPDEDVERSP